MAFLPVDDLSSDWVSDATGLWTARFTSEASRFGSDNLGMEIVATAGDAGATPFLRRDFPTSLDLSGFDELRFWFRSTRTADGSENHPFYVAFEAAAGFVPGGTVWQRLLPVARSNAWQLQRLWLGDMPPTLRQAIGAVRLRGLGPVGFTAAIDDLIATSGGPIENSEAALLDRLDDRFQVDVSGTPTPVPAVVNLPEAPETPTLPYILLTPWSIRLHRTKDSGAELVDGYTGQGAFVRPAPGTIELVYQIDVFASLREQKTHLLDAIASSFVRRPFLIVGGERLSAAPTGISSAEAAQLIPPGRTPLFLQVVSPIEAGDRVFRPQALPFLGASQPGQPGAEEYIRI